MRDRVFEFLFKRRKIAALTHDRDHWRSIAATRNVAIAEIAEDRDRFRDFSYLTWKLLHGIAKQCMCSDERCAQCVELWNVLEQCPDTVVHASSKVRK